jgi:general secretion pathway protein M
MSPSVSATPRHALIAVAVYAGSLVVVVALGLMLSLANRELQNEYATKAQLLDGLRRTSAANAAKAGASAVQMVTLVAPTETTAASELQKQIVERLNAAGGSVQSVQAEPAREAAGTDGLRRLVAKLAFESSVTALQRLLFELETGTPFMFVDSLAVQPVAASAPGMRADDRLRVTLAVSSYWKSNDAGQRTQ